MTRADAIVMSLMAVLADKGLMNDDDIALVMDQASKLLADRAAEDREHKISACMKLGATRERAMEALGYK